MESFDTFVIILTIFLKTPFELGEWCLFVYFVCISAHFPTFSYKIAIASYQWLYSELDTCSSYGGVATGGGGGKGEQSAEHCPPPRSAPLVSWQRKVCQKIEKRGENQEKRGKLAKKSGKRGKIWKKSKNREGSLTQSLRYWMLVHYQRSWTPSNWRHVYSVYG